MGPDEELAKKFQSYQEVAKDNPNVDVGMLMLNALQTQKQNYVSTKKKWWIYTISSSIPMSGFLFAIYYYYFGEEDDSRQVAWISIGLTLFSTFMYWALAKATFSGTGASVQQIQQIKPSDIMQLTQ